MNHETLTYEEFADMVGISVDDAKTRVDMAGWVVEKGADGGARIKVPIEGPPAGLAGPETQKAGRAPAGNGSELRTLRQYVADLRRQLDVGNVALDQAFASLAAARDERKHLLDAADLEREQLLEGVRRTIDDAEAASREQMERNRALTAQLSAISAEREKADAETLDLKAALKMANAEAERLRRDLEAADAAQVGMQIKTTAAHAEISRLSREIADLRRRGLWARIRNA